MSQNTLQNNSNSGQISNFSQSFLEQIAEFKPKFGESLANYSTWKVGGNAEILVVSTSAKMLEQLVVLAIENNVKYTILGHISNVLISDKGLKGLVIINKSREAKIVEKINSGQSLENEKNLQAEIIQNAQILWNYHKLNQKPEKTDLIWVLGSSDTRVAKYAADLFLQGIAPKILFCGSFGRRTKGVFEQSEAETFAKIAMENGVPSEAILIENQSTNTGQNIQFGYNLLKEKNSLPQKVILVQKPFMERRAWATFDKQYPDKIEFITTSMPIEMENYPDEKNNFEHLVNRMVGNLERIKIYPKLGFQTYQEIPESVWQAFENLVKLGFDKELTENSEYKKIKNSGFIENSSEKDQNQNPDKIAEESDNYNIYIAPRHSETGDPNFYSFADLDYDESQLLEVLEAGGLAKSEVVFDSGVDLSYAIAWSLANGLTGLQWFAGIPGTMGGALYNNIHGGTRHFSDNFVSCKVLIPIEDE